jgi:hypothetical protein
MPIFTDVEALRNWDSHTPYIGLEADRLFPKVVSSGADEVVVNPFPPARLKIRVGKRMTRRELEFLAKGLVPRETEIVRLEADETVYIGVPANKPDRAVLNELMATAEPLGAVSELVLFQIAPWRTDGGRVALRSASNSRPAHRARLQMRS